MTEVIARLTPEERYRECRTEEARINAQDERTFERNNKMRFYFLIAGAVIGPLVFFYFKSLSWENLPLAIAASFIGFMGGSIVSFFFERDTADTIALVNRRNEAARQLVEKATAGTFLQSDYVYLKPGQWNEFTLDFGAHVKTMVARVSDDAIVEWKPKVS